ncbi:MAG: hypothetical protein ACTSO7_10955 [Candidatus Heimdallarchaeota archaeon]
MSDEKDNSTIVEDEPSREMLEEIDDEAEPKRFTLKTFLRKSGLSIVLGGIAILTIILGVILYYTGNNPTTQKTGLWLGIVGVVIFMLTTIFGFERIE